MNKLADASGAPSSRREKWLAGTSGVRIPFRRAAKRSSTLCHPRRPCSSAQIRSPGAKRKYSIVCFEALINCYWGAKRARSALGAGRSSSNERWLLEVCSRRQPYRGPKRVRSALGSSRDETGLSWQSLPPLPPDNRCLRLIHFRRLASWVAKRCRSALGAALGGGRKPSLSVRSLPHPNNSGSSSTCTRDWANLGDGPAGVIAELALASDVADYVRFRAVCKPWRQCSPDPRAGLDVRFLPRRWIMLDKTLAWCCHHRFLNVSTGECIWMGLPELLEGEHRLLEVTPEGLLLLFHKPTEIGRLLNPLTRQLIDLPPLTAFVKGGVCCNPGEQGPFVQAVGLTEDSIVVVSFCHPLNMLAFAKPGDDSWTVVNDGYINSALAFAGRFYCATYRGVMVLNSTNSDQQQPPRLTMVADLNKSSIYFSKMMHSLNLVDNGGELMLVHQTIDQKNKCRKYTVYRLDLEAGILIPVKCLNGRALFMGVLSTISVSVEAFPYITADTIYLGFEYDIYTEEYNIADGSRYSRIYGRHRRICGRSVSPGTIVESLIDCIQDQDIVNLFD